jgi:cytochrome P450
MNAKCRSPRESPQALIDMYEPGLEVWDPTHGKGRRLADISTQKAVEVVTAFGHGRHTCPAQPFSLATMTTSLTWLLAAFGFTPEWTNRPQPVRA